MRIITYRQTEHGGGVFERSTPMREVVGSSRITGEPPAEVEVELVQPRLAPVVHRLQQLVGQHQVPVLREQPALRRLEKITGGAQLCRADYSGPQPSRAVDGPVAFPQ